MGARGAVGNPCDTARTAFFVIADISGYTGFLAHNELTHAQGILAELTRLLIDELSAPFRFVELEGDAVFVFAPSDAVEDSELLVDIIDITFEFQELEHDRCRLVMRVQAKDAGIWMRLMLRLARPIVKREWQRHFAALRKLLDEDIARANPAAR